MKTINTSSWHYKLIKNFFPDSAGVPYSICAYRRALIIRMVMIAVSAVLIGSLFQMIGEQFIGSTMPFVEFLRVENVILGYIISTIFGALIAAVLGGASIGILIGLVALVVTIQESKKTEEFTNSIKESDNVAIKYVLAKHAKYCYQIQFKDDK